MPRTRVLLLPALLVGLLAARPSHDPVAFPQAVPGENQEPPNLPSRDVRAKAAYQDSLDDARKLLALAESLKVDIEKNDRYVVSIDTIHKTEEIEKLAKRIRGRMKQP